MLKNLPTVRRIKISNKLKKEILRYTISFFFAWLVSALISDFPYFKNLIIKSIGLDKDLNNLTIFLIESILNIFGFPTFSQGNFIKIVGANGLTVAYGCLGFRELAFFVIFILLQTGSCKNKLWYIPSGVILLILMNVIRIVIIAIVQYNSPENTDKTHEFISPALMYPTILFLWLFWLTKFGNTAKHR